jgi:hypothetical protein
MVNEPSKDSSPNTKNAEKHKITRRAALIYTEGRSRFTRVSARERVEAECAQPGIHRAGNSMERPPPTRVTQRKKQLKPKAIQHGKNEEGAAP